MSGARPVLSVGGLKIAVGTGADAIPLVRDVSFEVHASQTLCLVGESGCGKTMTVLSLMGLLPAGVRVTGGEVSFDGRTLDILGQRRSAQGLAMIFQEPMTALNPAFSVGNQIVEALRIHRGLRGSQARAEAVRLLSEVGLPAPDQRLRAYPHELSGGMRQRVVIAIALACEPRVLIADEPTTALDVTVQAQILRLLARLQQEKGLAIILVTHDMGVVSEVADEVVVMYAGQVVERGSTVQVIDGPAHPYSQALLGCMPSLPGADNTSVAARERLREIRGSVPPPGQWRDVCAFVDRCDYAFDKCSQAMPPSFDVGRHQAVRCWLREAGE